MSQALVTRYELSPQTVIDVLEAKKELLRHTGMLEFVDGPETMTSVGGLENLKHWLAQRRGGMSRCSSRPQRAKERALKGISAFQYSIAAPVRGIPQLNFAPTSASSQGEGHPERFTPT